MRTRSRVARWIGLSYLVVGCHSFHAESAANTGTVLPLRAMRLYENGVGYFEREGRLTENGGATLGVPASHVDDALKTLVVLSHGDAKVSGIEFSSVVSDGAARSLAGLPLEGDSPVDYGHLLQSLKGFRVEVARSTGEAVRGRLLNVEPLDEPAQKADTSSGHISGRIAFSLLLVTDGGALLRVPTTEVEKVQPLDPQFSARLQTAADALGGRAAQLGRELRVLASSNAPVRIGYIAETPVWRPTYRLVLPPEGARAELQGWALVHNDTDEAWRDVRVELVNGAPDSFLFPLAAPRYARRELAKPENQLATVPQLALQTADGLWGDNVESESIGDTYGAGGLGLSGVGEGGSGTGDGVGFGSGHGRLGGVHAARSSTEISIGDLAAIPNAKGQEEGRLFSYQLSEPVSLRAHGSSLLPLLRNAVTARRLTRFDSGEVGRATVRFQNDSPYILPAGPVAIFESGGFAGETLIQRMTPTERVFLEYGTDLDATLDASTREVSRAPAKITWDAASKRLSEHYVQISERALTLQNHGRLPRTAAYVLSDVVQNAKVEGADELDYDDRAGQALALIGVSGPGKVARTLRITEGRTTSTALSDLTTALVARLGAAESLPPSDRTALKAAAPLVTALEQAGAAVREEQRRQSEVEQDLARNRQHLQAMQSSTPAANPIATRIVALEHALEASRKALALAKDRMETASRNAGKGLETLLPKP
jgi:hypothetical protein